MPVPLKTACSNFPNKLSENECKTLLIAYSSIWFPTSHYATRHATVNVTKRAGLDWTRTYLISDYRLQPPVWWVNLLFVMKFAGTSTKGANWKKFKLVHRGWYCASNFSPQFLSFYFGHPKVTPISPPHTCLIAASPRTRLCTCPPKNNKQVEQMHQRADDSESPDGFLLSASTCAIASSR